jgi:hypothetical protein
MRLFLFAGLCCLLPMSALAQYTSSYSFVGNALVDGDFKQFYTRKPDSSIKAEKIKSIHYQNYKKSKAPGNYSGGHAYHYDQSGRLKINEQYNSKGKLTRYYFDSADAQNRILVEVNNYKYSGKRHISKNVYTYHDNSSVPSVIKAYSGKKNNLIVTTVNELNNGEPASAKVYYYDKKTAGNTIEYIRDSSGQIKFIKLYNKKGKLSSITNYTCNRTGNVQKRDKVDEDMVCKTNEKLPNGHRIETSVHQYSKFYTDRTVKEFDEQDRLIAIRTYGGKQGEYISWKCLITYTDTGRWTESEHYDTRKKKPVIKHYQKHLMDGKVTRYNRQMVYSRKGKPISAFSFQYGYDSNNVLTMFTKTDEIKKETFYTEIKRTYYP